MLPVVGRLRDDPSAGIFFFKLVPQLKPPPLPRRSWALCERTEL